MCDAAGRLWLCVACICLSHSQGLKITVKQRTLKVHLLIFFKSTMDQRTTYNIKGVTCSVEYTENYHLIVVPLSSTKLFSTFHCFGFRG